MTRVLFPGLAALWIFLAGTASGATITSLPAATPFSWNIMGNDNRGVYTVTGYKDPATGNAGNVITYTRDIWDVDLDPNEPAGDTIQMRQTPFNGVQPEEKIGTMTFQFALWTGHLTANPGDSIDAVGAVIFGGFKQTDTNDLGGHFSFWQSFQDTTTTRGAWWVDGGPWNGKVNDTVSNRYNADPGWNFGGNATQWDYLDRPFDRTSDAPETINFETALICYDPATKWVVALADFIWGFTWAKDADGNITLTGMAPTEQSALSLNITGPYGATTEPPGARGGGPNFFQNIGVGSCHDCNPLPGPGTLVMVLAGAGGFIGFFRRPLIVQRRTNPTDGQGRVAEPGPLSHPVSGPATW